MFKSKEKKATGVYVAGSKLHIVELCRRGDQVFLLKLVEWELDEKVAGAPLASDEWRKGLVEGLVEAGRQELVDYTNPILGLDDRAVLLKRRPLVAENEKSNR